MPTLNCSGSKDKTTQILPSHPDQQSEQSVLPPFSGELSVDEKLKLSNANFKQTIDDFFEDKTITPLSQLTATPPFPTPHVMAQFASKTYTDYEKIENDAKYENRLALPKGWKLLTTASNSSMTNGYFGAAYWHSKHQQVVIAHRGTDPANLGALWADLKGVTFNHYVSQMNSASTFAHKVVEVLREVNQEKGLIFQVFFTGHSLGGWLAQITTFTTEYLHIERNTFVKGDTVPQSYHPHTVVFDSPGCKDMLSQMTDKFDVRLDGRSIDIEHLDITSYLSAPNRINTCNEHTGTVYRIFTDLSDMGWWEKHTALYNLATHSMDKFLEAFDPNTGQVREDEQGKLKVQVVIDWPVSSGLRGGEEYKSFFKWANDLNDYHQEVTDVPFHIEGYHPMRYQTKPYDKRVSRLSVFSQKERQFLESYHWLRQLPEFFKPQELFSLMKDNQAQEYAEKMLQGFQIENDKIRCTDGSASQEDNQAQEGDEKMLQGFEIETEKIRCADGSALQAFIPYVKRLIQLFPQVKESTTRALSSDEVRKRVYQIETRRYIERISQSTLDFKADDLSLRDFVTSGHQQVLHLQMVDGDEWTGLIKVYQVLQKTACLKVGQYTVLKLNRLLSVNQLMDFSTLMQSTGTPHLLLMACDTNQLLNTEGQHLIRTIFNNIKDKPFIKIFLSTRSEGTTLPSLQQMGREIFGEGFVRRDEHLKWSDLITVSQEKLLEKSVKFQGAKISLNKLMSAESAAANFLPLCVLLGKKKLKIADPVPISNGYNEGYYIGRTLRRLTAIKQEIFYDKTLRDSHVYLAGNEQEFKQLCQHHPKSSVHWLQKDESGKILWQQSQGSLKILREYIDTDSSHTYTADDLDNLLEQAQHQRVVLISDTAGMGKSTVLTHLSKQIKEKFPAKWVVRIDLNDHTDALKTLEEEKIDKKRAVKFISEKVLKLKPDLEMELFKQCCKQKQNVRVVIMLDGFDEVCPYYEETVIDLLQALRQTAVEQLWVTTRPHLRKELEHKVQQLSYTIEPFSKENQIEFLTKFWSLKDWVTKMDNNEKQENNKKLEIYAEKLIKKLVQSIGDKEIECSGIPLQTRMLAEAFEREVKIFCQSPDSVPELPSRLDLIGLYEKFIESKYDIYQGEKFKVRVTNVIANERRKRDFKIMREDHQLLALKVVFNEETEALFKDDRECTFSDKELSRIGIVQVSHDGKPHFIHRTFAEYCVADCLVNRLAEGYNTSEQIQNFILKDIFLGRKNQVIRVLIDGLISRFELSAEVLKQYGNGIRDGELILHQAAEEDNANIIGFLLDSVQAADQRNTIRRLLLVHFKNGELGGTAWHVAALKGNMQVLQRLWDSAKKVLTPQELKSKLLLSTVVFQYTTFFCYTKHTALQRAAKEGKTEVFLKIWEWTKGELRTEELKNEVLLGKDKTKQTVWHMAAGSGDVNIVEKIWEWAKEKLTTEEFNEVLLAKDERKHTVWHMAAKSGNTHLVEKIWEWAKEKLTAEEIKNELLLATLELRNKIAFSDKCYTKHTALQWAAQEGKTEVFLKIWEWTKGELTTEELKNEVLLGKDETKQTLWHLATQNGNVNIVEKIWELAKEQLTTEEFNEVLLAKDESKQTVLHMAAKKGNIHIVEKIWEWAKEKLTTEELKNKLLLAKDDMEKTAFHVAAVDGKTQVLQKIWEWTKEGLTIEELKNEVLLGKDKSKQTVWHMAAASDSVNTVEKIWEFAKEKQITEEFSEVLLAKDERKNTVWHMAAMIDNTQILEKIWECAEEKLTTQEFTELLLAKDERKNTFWHVAAEKGNIQIAEKIWEWAKEKLTTEELKQKLLLAKDDMEQTAFHIAAELWATQFLQKICEWSTEKLTAEELKSELLLGKDKKNQTVWHMAAATEHVIIVEKLWQLAKEKLPTEEFNEVLLAKYKRKETVLHMAAKNGNIQIVEKIWEWAKEKFTTEKVSNKLLLAKDVIEETAFHVAARFGYTEVLQKLWEWGNEKLSPEELKSNLLLNKNGENQTAFHVAANTGQTEVLQKLWEWGNEQLSPEELKNNLLLNKNLFKKTAFHVAANTGQTRTLQKLWEWSNEKLSPEELKSNLLLNKNCRNQTLFHEAAKAGHTEVLQKLWEWGKEKLAPDELKNTFLFAEFDDHETVLHLAAYGNKEVLRKIWAWTKQELTPEELKDKILLAKTVDGLTAFYVAAVQGNTETLRELWECAKEKLTKEELNYKILLDKDFGGKIAWESISLDGRTKVLETLWECAKEELTPDELKENFLLSKGYKESTTWHLAAGMGYTKQLLQLWEWAKEELTTDELHNRVLLATDDRKMTAWHVAADYGKIESLQTIWEWAKQELTAEELKNRLMLAKDDRERTAFEVAAEKGNTKVLEILRQWAVEELTPEELTNVPCLSTQLTNSLARGSPSR